MKSVEFLDSLVTRFTIFTNGSAVNGTSDGGADCFIKKTGETILLTAGEHCSGYQAELVALKEALQCLSTNKARKSKQGKNSDRTAIPGSKSTEFRKHETVEQLGRERGL